ncbi:hypothetical protein GCM10009624_21410 [Gordonia sinesedis]
MNLADQIDAVARSTIDQLAAASRAFSAEQLRLGREFDERAATGRTDRQLRADLETAADAADSATPRIMLPADMAGASPHLPPADELG